MSIRNYCCRILPLVFLVVQNQFIIAQNFASKWVFNEFTINFEKDSAFVERNNLADYRSNGYASICDADGNLILYSNGINVWNRNNELIENGDSLLNPDYLGTSLRASLIIPAPGNADRYFIFNMNPYNGNEFAGLYFSEADMSANEGNGKILRKGIRLIDSTGNQITALYHANRHDVWVITHRIQSNSYYAFLITDDGVSEKPVVSTLGKIHDSSFEGQLKGSPDGRKVAVSYNTWRQGEGFDLFDFNNETGKLSNAMSFLLPYQGCHGIEFSPDAVKLYAYESGSIGTLYQFKVYPDNYDSILASRKVVLMNHITSLEYMQLGPDGVIYITKGGGGYDGTMYLGTISKPNEDSAHCEAVELGLYLEGADAITDLFPHYIQNYFFKTNYSVHGSCPGENISYIISNTIGIDSVDWDFGDHTSGKMLNPVHKYSNPGNYNTRLIVYYPEKTDTLYKPVVIHELPVVSLGNDTAVCSGHLFTLRGKYSNITWHDGSHLKYFQAKNTGIYSVQVSNSFGCIQSDSINVFVNPSPVVNLGKDTTICSNSVIRLNAGQNNAGNDRLWHNGSKEMSFLVTGEGKFWLQVTNEYNCITKDEINIATKPAPEVNLGNDTTLTGFDYLSLDAGFFGHTTTYLWNDNSTFRYKYINGSSSLPGTYKVFVRVTNADHCTGTDTVKYTVLQDIKCYNDCLGRETVFLLGSPGIADSVFWDFGDGNSSGQVTAKHTYAEAGEYYISSIIYSGSGTDTVSKPVRIIPFPEVNLGEDISIIPNSILTLDAGAYDTPVSYYWDNYSTDQYRNIFGNDITPGTHMYFVRVISKISNCSSSDTIRVTLDVGTKINPMQNAVLIKEYPNPVENVFFIENPLMSHLKVIIYDISGNTMGQWQLVKGNNQINVEYFKPGIYFLHFPDQNMRDIKIIKYSVQ
ncbi:MAG TPA: PKD domain-containing protein [Bacteroidales bacterium]|nr:PKD domain-containing protein [Bacteroidales bacterium]